MNAHSLKTAMSDDQATPKYLQIKKAIANKIKSGEWPAGQLIPSENQLAEELGASRMTVNRPLRELAAEGLLRRVHGVGTFVAEPPRQASLIELSSIAEEIKAQGKQHRAEVLGLHRVKAKANLAERMGVAVADTLFQISVVHYQDEVPIQLESRYVNPSVVPDFMQVDFSKTTPADYLIKHIRPDELEHVVQAIMPDEFMCKQLSIPSTEPCISLLRRTWINGQIVTSAELIYPSSRYQLGSRYFPTSSH